MVWLPFFHSSHYLSQRQPLNIHYMSGIVDMVGSKTHMTYIHRAYLTVSIMLTLSWTEYLFTIQFKMRKGIKSDWRRTQRKGRENWNSTSGFSLTLAGEKSWYRSQWSYAQLEFKSLRSDYQTDLLDQLSLAVS